MARRRRAGVSKPSKPSTDVASDGMHHLNIKPASQVALSESAPAEDALDKIANLLATLASRPEDFYRRNEAVAKKLTGALKDMFAFARRSEGPGKSLGPLQELLVDGLDCESIWAELELRNKALEKHTRRSMGRLLQSERVSLAAEVSCSADEADKTYADESDQDATDKAEDMGLIQDFGKKPGSKVERETEKENGREAKRKQPGAREGMTEAGDDFFDVDDMDVFADEDKLDDELDDGVLNVMYGEVDIERRNPGGPGDKYSDSGSDEEDEADGDDQVQDGHQTVGGAIKYTDFYGHDEGSAEDEEFDGDGEEESDPDQDGKAGKPNGRGLMPRETHGQEVTSRKGAQTGDAEDGEQSPSAHALVVRRLRGKISDQEQELVSEKPWALLGEVHAGDRPENSLLEATVDVDHVTRPMPLPTPERATTLLDMIKKRCLDANWDDVTPRSFEGPPVRKDGPELSQEKSKEGLGDLYEKEFLKKTMGIEEGDPQAGSKTELKKLFHKLCTKLDSLCNFHYTPKAAIPEMKVIGTLIVAFWRTGGHSAVHLTDEVRKVLADAIIRQSTLRPRRELDERLYIATEVPEKESSSVPQGGTEEVRADVAAIAMEEVLPSSVADAEALAPEEVYAKKRGKEAEFLEAAEMGQADRKRVRSSKKAARRKVKRQVEMERKLVSKLNPGLGNRYEKSKMFQDIRSVKNLTVSPAADGASQGKEFRSSSKFFTNLQKTVEATIVSDGRNTLPEEGGNGSGGKSSEFRL